MLQDIFPHQFKNEFTLKRSAIDTDEVFVIKGNDVLSKGDGKVSQVELPKAKLFNKDRLIYLFKIDEKAYYLYNDFVLDNFDLEAFAKLGFAFNKKQIFRSNNPQVTCFAAFTACHLHTWYRDNQYCGRCGQKVEFDTKERALKCPNCGNFIYPKIAPAVIVGITDGDKIVVTQYKDRPYRGVALIAGFCEIGESYEQTAIREAQEEVGLKIKDLKYFGSQPWGMDSNMLVGFFAKVDGDTKITREEDELAVAVWKRKDELEVAESSISLTKTMIKYFKEHGNI